MNSGGVLTFSNSALFSSFAFTNTGEALAFTGAVDGAAGDSFSSLSLTRSGHTITLAGSIAFDNDLDTFSGTVSSLEFTTAAGDEILMHGAATISGPGSAPVFGGQLIDLTVTTSGSINIISGVNLTTSLVGVATNQLVTLGNLTQLAFGGNDTVTGDAGDNLLEGGDGNDSLVGLAGNDTLDGGAGNDTLIGGAGNDTYVVDSLLDKVIELAGAGVDTVQSSIDFSLALLPAIENLTLIGTAVAGTGNALANYILGNAGDNSLSGLGGNDTLDGGAGADSMNGGAGNDRYLVDSLTDVLSDSGGIDTVVASVSGWALGTGFENLILMTDGLGTGNALNNVLTDGEGTVTLQGLAGNDTYNITFDDVIIEDPGTAGGKDLAVVSLNAGEDYLLADNVENLTLLALESALSATGNALGNLITGTAAADSVDGGAGNDTILGGAGNDTLTGGGGKDSLAGGLGNDVFITTLVNPTLTTVALDAAISDTGGIDTLMVSAGEAVFVPATFNLLLNAAIENLDFSGVDGQHLNATGNALHNSVTGNSGNNKIDGAAGDDTIFGNAGHDTLLGGAGNDSLEGGDGNDWLDGGLGIDTMKENFGDDTFVIAQDGDTIDVIEDNGIDTVRVALATSGYLDLRAGNSFLENVVFTGTGAVTIHGNDSANSLVGGAGADTFFGGLGDDTIAVNSLLDRVHGEDGTDTVVSTISYSIAALDDIENLTLAGTAAKATGNAGDNVLTGNAAANTLDGGAGADTMIGGNGSDTYFVDDAGDVVVETMPGAAGGIDLVNTTLDFDLTGSQIENATVLGATGRLLTGNDLRNKLIGGAGADTLLGGLGDDTLTGNAGDDRLDGGTGNDSMAGGLGNDTYVVDSAFDKITELANQGIDTVEAGFSFSIAAAPNLENITLTGTGAFNATGNSGNNVLIGNASVNSLSGGLGNDTLSGGGGNDTLDGGGGTDTALYAGNQADYTIISLGGGSYSVVSVADGTDTLVNIEKISFADAPDLLLADVNALQPALDAGALSRLVGSGTIEITYSFMSAVPDYAFDPHPGFQVAGTGLQAAISAALQLWADVTNIHFTLVADSNSAQFRFGTELQVLSDDPLSPNFNLPDISLAGYAYLPDTADGLVFGNGDVDLGDVWLNRNFFLYDDSAAADFVAGTSVFVTLVHEIGHTLGLKHPFDPPDTLPPATNNNLYTIMAYDSAPHAALIDWADLPDFWWGYGGSVEASTPMLYDVSTIQALYGVNAATRPGDDVYGTNATDARFALSPSKPFFMTIWDGGGDDTIDISGFALPGIIDLRGGHFSSIGMSKFLGFDNQGNVVDHGVFDDPRADDGFDYLKASPAAPFGYLDEFAADHPAIWPDPDYVATFNGLYDSTNNLTIAAGVVIENAIGGSGADQVIGNSSGNRLAGGGGNDTLTGGGGADRFVFDTDLGASNVDTITDFLSGVDQVWLDHDIFAALDIGALLAGALHVFATASGALEADDRIRYNQSTGDLFYDPDGSGAGATVKFATLTGHPGLAAGDFTIIA